MATTAALAHPLESVADVSLVAGAAKGHSDHFEELVRRYQRQITAYVFRIVNSHDAALDVTQEVFIKVYNSLDKYSPDYKFSTWLYRIAHNASIDFLRRNSVPLHSLEVESKEGVFQIEIESPRPTPEEDRQRSEWRSEIEAVVRCLPSAYRELIVLRHGRDLRYDEIAEITGLPLGTVKNRLFRAREMMRELFVERGIEGI